ncbi:MAG: ribosome silencing factor [Gammaproteobacteria bacterium]|nr:ribosome silencing factor [Gammaproteobacteria bacterium]NNJ50584.1 ribosome silencing factor [Gammaproteobacteria bacterium]
MTIDELKQMSLDALEDLKAEDIMVLDVKDKTTVTDWIIIATGSSSRHVKSIANSVITAVKNANRAPLGAEGEEDGEWVLVDLGDVIVHIMQRQVREYYDLESLWSVDAVEQRREQDNG